MDMDEELIGFAAEALILQHGAAAGQASAAHLNAIIDLGGDREFWAAVAAYVHSRLRERPLAQRATA
jgi:hypothetical protein